MDRPDLSGSDARVIAYIEYLEERLDRLETPNGRPAPAREQPVEPPTTQQVVTISREGLIKRTPRHLYTPQRRGGMGVFDLDLPEGDEPAALIVAELESDLICLTNFARVFRLPLAYLEEKQVRSRGERITDHLNLHEKETVAAFLAGEEVTIAILTTRGFVLTRNKNFLKDGAILFDSRQSGEPLAACWTTGRDDLFVASTGGKGIRFGTAQVPTRGCLAIRLAPGDGLLGLTALTEDAALLLIGADGKGTARLAAGFQANKSPGAGGKVALNTNRLAGLATLKGDEDVVVISRQGKLIRFAAEEIPPKEGVVQGVNCITLRSDEVAAVGLIPGRPTLETR